ncbi:MAG: rhomboid family intramembrane serine protease [Planctomycetes bacterium]|nr:rhomboid family intramembrane serine protease [Planctomycetota bacterium]
MILPLAVDYPYENKPWATIGLVTANVLIFFLTFGLSDSQLAPFFLWPDRFAPWQWWTSGFLHAGFLHLGGNMLFLWVYGRYVEERIGPARFLLLYALFAPIESGVYILANLGSDMPAIGASGVISALMGVVIAAGPRSRVKTLIWWGPMLRVLPINAGLILGFWLLEQIAMVMVGVDGIAFSSHLGGFAAGAGMGLLMRYKLGGGWRMPEHLQSREDVDARAKTMFYGDLAGYLRRGREAQDRPGASHIPEWLGSSPAVQDPYEEEMLKRWDKR